VNDADFLNAAPILEDRDVQYMEFTGKNHLMQPSIQEVNRRSNRTSVAAFMEV